MIIEQREKSSRLTSGSAPDQMMLMMITMMSMRYRTGQRSHAYDQNTIANDSAIEVLKSCRLEWKPFFKLERIETEEQ